METKEWKELAFALADKATQNNLAKIAVKNEEFSIVIETHPPMCTTQMGNTQNPVTQVAVQQEEQETLQGTVVNAPLVGTFYAASAPEEPPMVAVGDCVKKGQTLCILEAMKMMNSIEAPCDGKITRILVQNGDLVEYNQPLLVIE